MATKAWRLRSTTWRRLLNSSPSSLSKRIRALTAASACGVGATRFSGAAFLLAATCKRLGCLQHRAKFAKSSSHTSRNAARARLSPVQFGRRPSSGLTEPAETRVINRRWGYWLCLAAADASAHTAGMNKMTKTGTGVDSAQAVRRVYEREAGNYDQNVKLDRKSVA